MKSIIIQKSANREVRIGWQDLPSPKKKLGDNDESRRSATFAKAVACTETEIIEVGDRAYLIDYVNGCSTMTPSESDCHKRQQQRSLDIIRDFQHAKKVGKNDYKPGWGYDPKVTKFGRYARHTILEAGAVSSRRIGGFGRGVEVTLTIPGGTDSAFRAVSQWSGWVVNRLLQVIRRRRSGIEFFYVWELQTRGALHLHMALSGAEQLELLRAGREIRKCWFRVLGEIGRKSNTNPFLRGRGYGSNTYREFLKGNRVAEIEKSLSAYFAKYVSKQAAKESTQTKKTVYPPSRWWGISRSLLKKVKQERLNVTITNLSEEQCIELLAMAEAFCRRHSPIRDASYSFELSYGSKGNAKPIGVGARWLYWFSDTEFDKVQVWLPQFIRFLSNYCITACSNAVIKGDTSWKTDKRESPWEKSRLTAEAVG